MEMNDFRDISLDLDLERYQMQTLKSISSASMLHMDRCDVADSLSFSPIHEKEEDVFKMDNPEIHSGLNFRTLQQRFSR